MMWGYGLNWQSMTLMMLGSTLWIVSLSSLAGSGNVGCIGGEGVMENFAWLVREPTVVVALPFKELDELLPPCQ